MLARSSCPFFLLASSAHLSITARHIKRRDHTLHRQTIRQATLALYYLLWLLYLDYLFESQWSGTQAALFSCYYSLGILVTTNLLQLMILTYTVRLITSSNTTGGQKNNTMWKNASWKHGEYLCGQPGPQRSHHLLWSQIGLHFHPLLFQSLKKEEVKI